MRLTGNTKMLWRSCARPVGRLSPAVAPGKGRNVPKLACCALCQPLSPAVPAAWLGLMRQKGQALTAGPGKEIWFLPCGTGLFLGAAACGVF